MEEPLEKYLFNDITVKSIPYEGPFQRFRPVVKWIVIIYIIVMFGISTLILHEQSFGSMLAQSIPILICLGWLWSTRKGYITIQIPIEIKFYQEYFTLDRPSTLMNRKGKDVKIREFYKVNYNTVTAIHYDLTYNKVTIRGTSDGEFYDIIDDQLQNTPFSVKHAENAAVSYWTDMQNLEERKKLLDSFEKYTGKKIEYYGKQRQN